jgi:hypothetical protein
MDLRSSRYIDPAWRSENTTETAPSSVSWKVTPPMKKFASAPVSMMKSVASAAPPP